MNSDGKFNVEKIEGVGDPLYDDEPVFVFRGRDVAAIDALNYYRECCVRYGSPDKHLAGVMDQTRIFLEWQRNNPDKTHVPGSHYTDEEEVTEE